MNYEFNVLVKNKKERKLFPIKKYLDKKGNEWVEAREGSIFALKFKNNSDKSVLIVSSIDGINVINGKRALIEPRAGYVVFPRSPLIIEGWRIGQDSIREFLFTSNKSESYSYKLGADKANVGVIGFAVFEESMERYDYNWNADNLEKYYPICTNDSITPTVFYNSLTSNCVVDTCSFTNSKDTSFSMATAQGQERLCSSYYSSKEFNSFPSSIKVIYYDSRKNLIKKEIIRQEEKMPNPFKSEFCPNL